MANQEMYKHDAMLHIVWVVAVEDRKDEAEKWATPEEDNYLDTIRKAEDINIVWADFNAKRKELGSGEKIIDEACKALRGCGRDWKIKTLGYMQRMGWVSQEGKYITEYLVTPKLLIKTMEKAGCVLVDTDLFVNLYNMNKEWFMNVIDYEENPKNKKFYKNVAKFYGDLKGAEKEGRIWNDLYRFYVFKKID